MTHALRITTCATGKKSNITIITFFYFLSSSFSFFHKLFHKLFHIIFHMIGSLHFPAVTAKDREMLEASALLGA